MEQIEEFVDNRIDKVGSSVRAEAPKTAISRNNREETVRGNNSRGSFDWNKLCKSAEATNSIENVGILEVIPRQGANEING